MIIKKISNNPLVNADRWAETSVDFKVNETIMKVRVRYTDSNGQKLSYPPEKEHSFTTAWNMVDQNTGAPAQLIDVITGYDEDNNPIMWRDRPSTAITEEQFMALLPNDTTAATRREQIVAIVTMKLDALDLQGKFN